MGKIVIDSSAIIAVVLGEPQREAMVRLTNGAQLIAPASLRWEVGNAFSAMFRKKRLSLKEALAAVNIFENIPVEVVEVSLQTALEISYSKGIYAYDAYMLACALNHKAPLLTLDAQLRQAGLAMKIDMVEV